MLRRGVGWVVAPSLALLLAACASLAPPYERPPAPVAERFPAQTQAAAPSVADIDWRSVFVDPRQRRLIELSLQNNRDLRLAAFNVEQAQARADAQGADLWPTLSAGVGGNRQALPTGGSLRTFSAGLLITAYELDFFGRLRSLSEAAQAQAAAAEQGRRTTQMALVAAVAATHLGLLADDEMLALTQQTLESRLETLRLVKLRFEGGTASELDFQGAQSVVAGARAALAQLQRRRAQDQNALVLLLGAPLPADLPQGAPTLAQMGELPPLPVGLPAAVLQRRPDILAAEQELIAANFNIGAARAAFFPQVSLTASAGTISGDLDGLFRSGSWGWSAAPQVLLTLFDAGRNRANSRAAEASRDAALALYDKAIQSAFREVADTLAGRDTLGVEALALQAQAQAEAVRLRLAELRYRNGVASSLDVLDAQRSLFAAQQLAVLARLGQAQNQVNLYKALGGGWSDAQTTAVKP